ncbi:UNVERIFIED_CONTAM: hypothetical protein Sindi_1006700 [Sesamum indicum]
MTGGEYSGYVFQTSLYKSVCRIATIPTTLSNATPFARAYRYVGEHRWWEMKEIFYGDDIIASDATTSEDGDECSHGGSGSHSRRVQVEGEIEVTDLATSSEDE